MRNLNGAMKIFQNKIHLNVLDLRSLNAIFLGSLSIYHGDQVKIASGKTLFTWNINAYSYNLFSSLQLLQFGIVKTELFFIF